MADARSPRAAEPATSDKIAEEFKVARATYVKARQRAVLDLKAEFDKQREKVYRGEFNSPQNDADSGGSADDHRESGKENGNEKPTGKAEKGKTDKTKKSRDGKSGDARPRHPLEVAGEKAANDLTEKLNLKTPPGGPPPRIEAPLPNLGELAKDPEAAKRRHAERLKKAALPPDRDAPLREFDADRRQFTSDADGTLPTHPAMAKATAEFRRVLDAARTDFRKVIDQTLAAYEAAGVRDPAQLQPALGLREMYAHPELAGVWERRVDDQMTRREIWFVDVHPETGEWRVEGIDGVGLTTGTETIKAAYHGEQVEFKDGGLSFIASEYDARSSEFKDGTRMTLKPHRGQLQIRCEAGLVTGRPKPAMKNGKLNTEKRGEIKSAMLTRRDVVGLTKQMVFNLNKGGIRAQEGDGIGLDADPPKKP